MAYRIRDSDINPMRIVIAGGKEHASLFLACYTQLKRDSPELFQGRAIQYYALPFMSAGPGSADASANAPYPGYMASALACVDPLYRRHVSFVYE